MQAASGWAPLSHAVRFTPVFYLWMLMVVRLHVGWDSPSTRGYAFKSARTAEPPFRHRAVRRGPAIEPPDVARLSGRQVAGCCPSRPRHRAARSSPRHRAVALQAAGPLVREIEVDSQSKGACGSEANCGLRATRGSEAGRAFGLYCANGHGRCACSGGQGRFSACGLLAVPKRFATLNLQRVSYIPWNQDGFRMPPMFGVK